MNVTADLLIGYFKTNEYLYHTGNIRFIILLLFITINLKYIKQKLLINKIILITLFYLFILTWFSSNFSVSITFYLRVLSYLLIFPLAFKFINNRKDFIKLNRVIFISFFIVLINLVIAQMFKVGTSEYLQNSFYEGAGGAPVIYSILFVIIMPAITYYKPSIFIYKFLVPIFYSFGLLVVFIAMRRMGILAISIGLIIQILFLFKKSNLKILLLSIIGLLLSFPLYGNLISQRLNARLDNLSKRSLEEEGRYVEIEIAVSEFLNKSISHSMFGSELFNSRNYATTKYYSYWRGRTFHTLWAIFFHGAGLIGLFLIVLIYILLALRINMYKSFIFKYSKEWKILKIVANSLIIAWIIQLTSFGTWAITENCLFYIYIGGMLGYAEYLNRENKRKKMKRRSKIINIEI